MPDRYIILPDGVDAPTPAPSDFVALDKWAQPIEQPRWDKFLIAPSGQMLASRFATAADRGFYRSVTLSQPAIDQTDFTVIVTGTVTYLKTVANGGKVQNANGYDIIFYSDAALNTKLKFERRVWNGLTGFFEFAVKTTLTASSAKVIYLAYGNNQVFTDQQDAVNAYDTNTVACFPFGDGTTLSLLDSLGVANGTNSGVQAAAGPWSGAAFCDGSSNADFGNHMDSASDMTISLWHKAGSTDGYIFNKGNSDAANSGWMVYNNQPSGGIYCPWFYCQTGNNTVWKQGGFTSQNNDSVWRHFAFTKAGNALSGYRNGSNTGFTTQQGAGTVGSISNSDSVKLGSAKDGTNKYTGYVDEIKISSVARTATWIITEYNNQNDPATFCTIGAENPA